MPASGSLRLAALYELRLTYESEKAEYTKEEILQRLDQVAIVRK